jgi:hypothetical protein
MNRFLQAISDSRAPSLLCVAALLAVSAQARQQPPAPAAQETPAKVAAEVEPVEINILPLRVVAARVEAMLRKGHTDPRANFEMKVAADRLEDGTLNNVVFDTVSSPDEDVQALVQQLVSALSQSKVLGFMRDVPRIQLAFQVKEDVSIRIGGETDTVERARTMAQGYGALLDVASRTKKGTDEGELLAAIKAQAEGKLFTLTFRMPRAAVAEMLSKVRRPD